MIALEYILEIYERQRSGIVYSEGLFPAEHGFVVRRCNFGRGRVATIKWTHATLGQGYGLVGLATVDVPANFDHDVGANPGTHPGLSEERTPLDGSQVSLDHCGRIGGTILPSRVILWEQ